jgi:hypothetical protein
MADLNFRPQGQQALPEGGHEERDFNFKAVIISGAVLLAVMFGTSVGLIGIDHFLRTHADRLEQQPISRLAEPPEKLPPLPRLQVSPREEMQQLLEQEKARLNNYTYDEVTGITHIPIECAIDLISERGLPTRAATAIGSSGTAESSILTTGTAAVGENAVSQQAETSETTSTADAKETSGTADEEGLPIMGPVDPASAQLFAAKSGSAEQE